MAVPPDDARKFVLAPGVELTISSSTDENVLRLTLYSDGIEMGSLDADPSTLQSFLTTSIALGQDALLVRGRGDSVIVYWDLEEIGQFPKPLLARALLL